MYGYLGFLLTLGVLPVYVLTNLAAARYFARVGRFHPVRHGVLPIGGAALMVALLVGPDRRADSGAVHLAAMGDRRLGRARWRRPRCGWPEARPRQLRRAGAVLAAGEAEQHSRTRRRSLAR